MAQDQSTRVTSGKGLFSYANVFKPTAMDDKTEPKYNTQFIWKKSDKATTKKFEAAIKAAKDKFIKEKLGGKEPKKFDLPIRDGDEEKEGIEEYEGCWFISAKSYRKPKVVDRQFDMIVDPEDFYSGCYGAIVLNFYGYDVGANKGVAAGLESIMKLADGEPLGGGGGNVREDFAAFEDFDDEDLD
jgi:hypothetical protein